MHSKLEFHREIFTSFVAAEHKNIDTFCIAKLQGFTS
jgi:hypothetical protein